jgi:23S rRNA pseudouridine1911/1915/1917 synthase
MNHDEIFAFIISPQEAGERLDKILALRLPSYSRTQLQAWIDEGRVGLAGKTAKASLRPEAGDLLEVILPPVSEKTIIPQALPLTIVAEDEHFVVINKQAGLVVHPAEGHEDETLVNALLARYPQLMGFAEQERAGIVHRLDKYTSGVMVAALTPEGQASLSQQFHDRVVKKVYLALCDGRPPTPSGRIDAPIGRDVTARKRMAIVSEGRPAQTDYYTLREFAKHTLLELHPVTGRTHQLRVHLAYLGCPVAGDQVYGRRQKSLPQLGRFFLHAHSLSFLHPLTGEALRYEAPLAPELQAVLDELACQEQGG